MYRLHRKFTVNLRTFYAAETWILRKVDIQYSDWKHLKYGYWRRMMKISWTEHRSDPKVLDMASDNRDLISSIRQRQKNWQGHVLRGDSLLRTVLEGRMGGTGRSKFTVLTVNLLCTW